MNATKKSVEEAPRTRREVREDQKQRRRANRLTAIIVAAGLAIGGVGFASVANNGETEAAWKKSQVADGLIVDSAGLNDIFEFTLVKRQLVSYYSSGSQYDVLKDAGSDENFDLGKMYPGDEVRSLYKVTLKSDYAQKSPNAKYEITPTVADITEQPGNNMGAYVRTQSPLQQPLTGAYEYNNLRLYHTKLVTSSWASSGVNKVVSATSEVYLMTNIAVPASASWSNFVYNRSETDSVQNGVALDPMKININVKQVR